MEFGDENFNGEEILYPSKTNRNESNSTAAILTTAEEIHEGYVSSASS